MKLFRKGNPNMKELIQRELAESFYCNSDEDSNKESSNVDDPRQKRHSRNRVSVNHKINERNFSVSHSGNQVQRSSNVVTGKQDPIAKRVGNSGISTSSNEQKSKHHDHYKVNQAVNDVNKTPHKANQTHSKPIDSYNDAQRAEISQSTPMSSFYRSAVETASQGNETLQVQEKTPMSFNHSDAAATPVLPSKSTPPHPTIQSQAPSIAINNSSIEVKPEAVEVLRKLGFPAPAAKLALRRCDGNVEAAAAFCLENDAQTMARLLIEDQEQRQKLQSSIPVTNVIPETGTSLPTTRDATSRKTDVSTTDEAVLTYTTPGNDGKGLRDQRADTKASTLATDVKEFVGGSHQDDLMKRTLAARARHLSNSARPSTDSPIPKISHKEESKSTQEVSMTDAAKGQAIATNKDTLMRRVLEVRKRNLSQSPTRNITGTDTVTPNQHQNDGESKQKKTDQEVSTTSSVSKTSGSDKDDLMRRVLAVRAKKLENKSSTGKSTPENATETEKPEKLMISDPARSDDVGVGTAICNVQIDNQSKDYENERVYSIEETESRTVGASDSKKFSPIEAEEKITECGNCDDDGDEYIDYEALAAAAKSMALTKSIDARLLEREISIEASPVQPSPSFEGLDVETSARPIASAPPVSARDSMSDSDDEVSLSQELQSVPVDCVPANTGEESAGNERQQTPSEPGSLQCHVEESKRIEETVPLQIVEEKEKTLKDREISVERLETLIETYSSGSTTLEIMRTIEGLIHNRLHLPYKKIEVSGGRWKGMVSLKQPALDTKTDVSPQGDRPDLLSMSTLFTSEQNCETLCTAFAPPLWMAHGEASNCPICDKLFSKHRRELHCRNCGQLVCGNEETGCSKKVWPGSMLPTFYHNHQSNLRVCKPCRLLAELFAVALRTADADSVKRIHATGNINLHTPYSIYPDAPYPVHIAAASGSVELLRWLMEEECCSIREYGLSQPITGRPPLLRTTAGHSVLDIAARGGNLDMLQYLLNNHSSECDISDITDHTLLAHALGVALQVTNSDEQSRYCGAEDLNPVCITSVNSKYIA